MTEECERFRLLIHGYSDGELTPDQERAVWEHVRSCDRCARSLKEVRGLTENLDRMSLDFPEVHVWEAIRPQLLPARQKKGRARFFPIALMATMIVYKFIDLTVGFRVAILLKPAVILAVALLLAFQKQNPFRLCKTLNANSSSARG